MIANVCRLALLAVLLGIVTAPPTHAAETVNVVVPSRVIFYVPFWIADQRGFFRDEGIEAKLETVTDGRQITQRLLSGAAQFSIVGPDAVLIDATAGGPLRIVAGIVPKPPLFLIAKPSIKTFADLRGANIGVLSLTEGSAKILAKIAKAEGLAPDAFRVSAVGGAPTRWTLLREGKIDAGLQPLPLNYEAEAEGFSNLGFAATYEPEWQFTTVNTNSEWARRHPDTVERFLRAMLRGQQFIAANPQEAARIAAAELKTPLPLAARSLEDSIRLGILHPRLDWSEPGLRRIFENMQADGAISSQHAFDLGKVTEAGYLQRAQRALGDK